MLPVKAKPQQVVRRAAPKPVISTQGSALEPVIIMYGSPKTGKTTLSYAIEGAVHVMTERGTRNEHVRVDGWKELLSAVDGVPRSTPLVIDTIDGCWDMCNQYVADSAGVVSPVDMPWGQGPARVHSLWSLFVRSAITHPLTLFIGHEMGKMKNFGGVELEIFSHQLPQKGRYILEASADAIICLRRDGAKRTLLVRDGDSATVGCRYTEWFNGAESVDLTNNADKAVSIFTQQLATLV